MNSEASTSSSAYIEVSTYLTMPIEDMANLITAFSVGLERSAVAMSLEGSEQFLRSIRYLRAALFSCGCTKDERSVARRRRARQSNSASKRSCRPSSFLS